MVGYTSFYPEFSLRVSTPLWTRLVLGPTKNHPPWRNVLTGYWWRGTTWGAVGNSVCTLYVKYEGPVAPRFYPNPPFRLSSALFSTSTHGISQCAPRSRFHHAGSATRSSNATSICVAMSGLVSFCPGLSGSKRMFYRASIFCSLISPTQVLTSACHS